MDADERYYSIRQLLHEWHRWGTLERASAIVRLRNEGFSLRRLAKVAGCSEGTIRNYEILGRVPWLAKKILYDGRISMRRLVAIWREQQRRRPGNKRR